MATARMLEHYLTGKGAAYEVMPHEPTMSSMRTAETCHVPADSIAKGVVLKDGDSYLLAVLPASHQLELEELEAKLERHVSLATEDEIEALFPDCARGAIPPIGAAYGLDTIVDSSIAETPEVYFEAGDHRTLVHMKGQAFDRLLSDAEHASFSLQA